MIFRTVMTSENWYSNMHEFSFNLFLGEDKDSVSDSHQYILKLSTHTE